MPRPYGGPVLPPGGAEPGGLGSRSPSRRAPTCVGEAGRACSSSPGFCFPPGLTGPGFGSRPPSLTRPRPGARDRGRLEQATGPAQSRAAREQQPRGRQRNFALGAGTPRARWSLAHLAGPMEGEDNTVSGGCPARFRFALPGRWVWMRVHRLQPAALGQMTGEQHPGSQALSEGASAASILQVIILMPRESQLKVVLGLHTEFAPGAL